MPQYNLYAHDTSTKALLVHITNYNVCFGYEYNCNSIGTERLR